MSNNILNDISKVYLNSIAESAVPGKPAERLGAVTGIPQDEREAARQRTLAKAAAIRAKKGITQEGLDPVGKEDADIDNDGKSNTKKDKYLMHRRNVIKQELAKEAKEVALFFPQGASPWQRVLKYIVPVFILSAVFNIPKFFEANVFEDVVEESRYEIKPSTKIMRFCGPLD